MNNVPQPDTSRIDVSRFSAVDDTAEPSRLIRFLEVAKLAPEILAGKEEMLHRLEPERASRALDVGCGYGADVVALAERMRSGGESVGVDVSEAMIAEARRRTAEIGFDVSFRIADAVALPFDDDTFDVCRIETVLQHLADPARGIAEMVRVTRRGGRMAAFEFDAGTTFLDHPDVELAELLRVSFFTATAQGSIGRQLRRLFVEAGLMNVRATLHVVLQEPNFFRLLLGHHVTELLSAGVITADRANRWWAAMDEAAEAGHFTAGAIAFVISGEVR